MNWQEAKRDTIRVWRRILDSLETTEEVTLLTEINAINELCEMADEEAHGEWGRCRYCPAYQQFGGCREVTGRLSELVVQKEWGELRTTLERFISRLEAMTVPPEAPPHATQ